MFAQAECPVGASANQWCCSRVHFAVAVGRSAVPGSGGGPASSRTVFSVSFSYPRAGITNAMHETNKRGSARLVAIGAAARGGELTRHACMSRFRIAVACRVATGAVDDQRT